MTLADHERLERDVREGSDRHEVDRRGWYDPDAASYVELVERVLAIQRRRAARQPATVDTNNPGERG